MSKAHEDRLAELKAKDSLTPTEKSEMDQIEVYLKSLKTKASEPVKVESVSAKKSK